MKATMSEPLRKTQDPEEDPNILTGRPGADERELLDGYKPHAVGDGGVGGPKRADVSADHLQKQRELRDAVLGEIYRLRLSDMDELLTVLRGLPTEFLSVYLMLMDATYGETNMGSGPGYRDSEIPGAGRQQNPWPVTSSAPQGLRGAQSKFNGKSRDFIRSQKNSDLKDRTDRRLRKLTREIKFELSSHSGQKEPKAIRQCAGTCRKFGEAEWLYCPRCGGPMQEVD